MPQRTQGIPVRLQSYAEWKRGQPAAPRREPAKPDDYGRARGCVRPERESDRETPRAIVWPTQEQSILVPWGQSEAKRHDGVSLGEVHGSLGELCLRSLSLLLRKGRDGASTVSTSVSLNLITIHFDGGCRPSNPGNKYGSYEVNVDGIQIIKASRIEFGWGTSNEAEFNSLIAALQWTVENLYVGGFDPSIYTLDLFSDSLILVNRVRLRNCAGKSEPAKRMGKLTRECLNRMTLFRLWRIEWRGRESNVQRFGH